MEARPLIIWIHGGSFAFESAALKAEAKIGILAGSLIAGVVGAIALAALKDPSLKDRELPDEEGFEMSD